MSEQATHDATKRYPEYGCHVDLFDGEEADDCVINYDAHSDCAYGHTPSGRPRRSPHTCKFWQKRAQEVSHD